MENEIVTVNPEAVSLGVIQAVSPRDVVVRATAIAKELSKIVKEQKLFSVISGRNYVKVEGWSTLGAMVGIVAREVPGSVKRYDDGSYEASVDLIRVSDGAIIGGASAYVGMDEKDRNGKLTWGARAEYARRSMAVTRAAGKAFRLCLSWIIALAGFEPTPAEEMDGVIDGQFTDSHKPEPVKKEYPEPSCVIDLDTAKKVTTSKGELYDGMETYVLEKVLAGIDKHIADNHMTDDERAEITYKRDAALTILRSR